MKKKLSAFIIVVSISAMFLGFTRNWRHRFPVCGRGVELGDRYPGRRAPLKLCVL